MLKSIFIIFSYQLIGEVIQKIFELYIPGPVIGLILLLFTLRFVKNLGNDFFKQHIEGDLIRNSEYILSHLPFLFVPIGVGVVMHITYLEENQYFYLQTCNEFIKYNNILSKYGFKEFLKNLYKFGFCVITDCKTEIETVKNIANKIGYVRQSIFGGLWEFESNEDMADSAYTQEELRPHTDSTYSNDAPGLQLLLCCDYKASGGESIMVDGFKIANMIKDQDKKIFDILSNIEVPGKYVGDGVILEAKRPIFKLNSNKELVQVSFNNYDRAEFRLENEIMINFYKAIKKFDNLVNESEFQWRHILKPGELLIFNNWRVLHGRGSFKGKRKIVKPDDKKFKNCLFFSCSTIFDSKEGASSPLEIKNSSYLILENLPFF